MRTSLLDAVRMRFNYGCGYCGTHEEESGARLTIDHYRPRSRGGTDATENLVYCCHACNEFKGSYWTEDIENRILHPLRDDLTQYYVERLDHNLVPLNERGRLHIDLLRLNRAEQIATRRRRYRTSENEAAISGMQHQFEAMQTDINDIKALLTRFSDIVFTRLILLDSGEDAKD